MRRVDLEVGREQSALVLSVALLKARSGAVGVEIMLAYQQFALRSRARKSGRATSLYSTAGHAAAWRRQRRTALTLFDG